MKKVLALALAFVLVMGMATIGSAAAAVIGDDFTYGLSGDVDNLSIAPGASAIKLTLTPGSFSGLKNAYLTTNELSSAKIDVTAKKTAGYPTLDAVKIKSTGTGVNTVVYIEVTFIKELIATKSVDFEYVISMTLKGKKIAGTDIIVAGTMENPKIFVDADTDTVDLSDGSIAEAEEYVKGIEIEAGNGVYVTMNMFKDQKYYCKAVMDVTGDDKAIVDKYPQIDGVLEMHMVNISKSAVVNMDLDSKYYVYDASGKYVGVSTDKLPLSAKYFLSSSKIDMGNEVEVESAPVDPANPPTGGDNAAPNANDNPGTGANGLVNVAVVAGLVALAAAGAVSMKK